MNEINIVHSLPQEEWRRFVETNPNGNIFHTPEMFEVYAKTKGCQPTLWAAVDKAGNILALLLPVQITLREGLLRYLTTRAIVYGSILTDPSSAGRDALSMMLQSYIGEKNHVAMFTELRNLSDLKDVQSVMNRHGFVYEDHLNYIINLNHSPAEVFENIGRRTRKNIRHGLNRGDVVIEEVKKFDQVGVCYKLLAKTYKMAGVPLADPSLFSAAFEFLRPRGMIRFTLASMQGVPIATSIDLLYRDVIYGWYGGLDRAYKNSAANELLMWNILEWGVNKGYRIYDFGGAGKPDEKYGVRDFKAKFGGDLVCYGRNIWIAHPLLYHTSKTVYNVVRRAIA